MNKTILLFINLLCILLVTNLYSQECPTTQNYNTVGLDTYVVPSDAYSVTINLKGADGGDNTLENQKGGEGALVTATFPVCPECTVKPGSTINLYLGGAGVTSDDRGGAGGGGASVAIVDNVAYPLIIAAGGGGASATTGGGGQDELLVAANRSGSGGASNLAGGGGGGAGATDTVLDNLGQTAPGDDGDFATGSGLGGAAHAEIMTAIGGAGGRAAGNNTLGLGRNGGVGGGGAGGDGYDGVFNDYTGAGGAGAGYVGGDGSGGQAGSEGGHSYTYDGHYSESFVEGVQGGGSQSNGSASICYTSNASAAACDGTNQLINPTFNEFSGFIDQSSKDIYVDDASICREGWAITGSFENNLGSGEGAGCDEIQFDADLAPGETASGELKQTVANICKSQEVEVCFDFQQVEAAGADSELIVTLGGQVLIRFFDNGSDNTYEDGADADDVTVINEGFNVNKEPGDNLVSAQTYRVCIKDFNYDGDIPAQLKLAFTSANNGGGEDVINLDNFSITYSNIGAPNLQDESTLSETPGACIGTFDLTTMAPSPIADGLVLSYKDSDGVIVSDPTSVDSGTYSICYERDSSNLECSATSGCADESCTEVTVSCSLICTAPALTNGADGIPTLIGISTLDRNVEGDWLGDNAFIKLESKTYGFVPSRMSTTNRDDMTAEEGMVIWNTTTQCLEFYNGISWVCSSNTRCNNN